MNKQRIKELICLLVDEFWKDITVIESESESESEEKEVVEGKMNLGYYTYWYPTTNDLSKYTHISYAFLDINSNGMPNATEIEKISMDFNGKRGLSIGGSVGSGKAMNILKDDVKRKLFIKNAMDYIDDNNFSYINYDLEYPDQDLIEKILSETKEYIDSKNYNIKISVCLACWRGFVKPYKNCNQYIDWVELMVYDDKNIIFFAKEALELLKGYGYPNNKILIGNSLDKNGIPDTTETLAYKSSIKHLYGGEMLWEVSLEEEEEKIISNTWSDKWDNPYRLMQSVRGKDPYDETTTFRGNGKLWIEDGIMTLSGSEPRMYVNVDIRDVNVSVDYKRIGNDGANWSGCIIGVRSDPEGHGKSPEKAHTYYGRLKNGGEIDFYKEEQHGGNKTGIIHSKKFSWVGDKWINVRFKCYNLENNNVKLEFYVDNKLELEYIDADKLMYDNGGVVFLRATRTEKSTYKNLTIETI